MWDYAGHAQGGVDQATGNKPTFEENILDRKWYSLSYDLTIAGRLVLVNSRDRFTCMTTVKSAHSPVHTAVTRTSHPPTGHRTVPEGNRFHQTDDPQDATAGTVSNYDLSR